MTPTALFLVACSTGSPVPQLDPVGIEGSFMVREGTLSVTPTGDGFALALAENADFAVTIRSSAGMDLSSLEGREVSMSIDRELGTSLSISDEMGPVYVASDVYEGTAPFSQERRITLGEHLAKERRDGVRIDYHEAIVPSDDGDFPVLPGEEVQVTVDGALWSVVVLQAYETHESTGGAKCGGGGEAIAFEAMRIEAPAEPRVIEGSLDFALRSNEC